MNDEDLGPFRHVQFWKLGSARRKGTSPTALRRQRHADKLRHLDAVAIRLEALPAPGKATIETIQWPDYDDLPLDSR